MILEENWTANVFMFVCVHCIQTHWGDAVAVKPLFDLLRGEVTSCRTTDRIARVSSVRERTSTRTRNRQQLLPGQLTSLNDLLPHALLFFSQLHSFLGGPEPPRALLVHLSTRSLETIIQG